MDLRNFLNLFENVLKIGFFQIECFLNVGGNTKIKVLWRPTVDFYEHKNSYV